jgi:hypothetical protein
VFRPRVTPHLVAGCLGRAQRDARLLDAAQKLGMML